MGCQEHIYIGQSSINYKLALYCTKPMYQFNKWIQLGRGGEGGIGYSVQSDTNRIQCNPLVDLNIEQSEIQVCALLSLALAYYYRIEKVLIPYYRIVQILEQNKKNFNCLGLQQPTSKILMKFVMKKKVLESSMIWYVSLRPIPQKCALSLILSQARPIQKTKII